MPAFSFTQPILLLCALTLTMALVWAFRGRRRYQATVVLAVAGLSLLLSFAGYLIKPPPGNPATQPAVPLMEKLTDALYLSVQQLFLNAPAESADNFAIHLARLCALATVALVAVEALRRLFADSFQQMLLRRSSDHFLICGLGRTGLQLLKDLRGHECPGGGRPRRLPRVIVIEPDAENDSLAQARDLGATIVAGDAADQDLLARVRADRAKAVFIVSGSDEVNIEAAYDLITLVRQSQPGVPPRIFVQVRHPELGSVLENAAHQSHDAVPVDVRPFNVLEESVLHVVSDQILPWRPRPGQVAHFVIVGFGRVGQALALKLAEQAHFENLKRSRMTIVYSPRERRAVERFRQIYPRMMPPDGDPWKPSPTRDDWSHGADGTRGVEFAVNGGFVEHDAAPESDAFIERIVNLAQELGVRPIVFLCKETDEENCTLAQELRAELDGRLKIQANDDAPGPPRMVYAPAVSPVPVFAYVPLRPMLKRLTASDDLISFGVLREVCSYARLSWPLQRPLAAAMAELHDEREHQRKLAALKPDEPTPVRQTMTFAQRPAWARHSSLSAAAHVNVKLAVLGLRVMLREDAKGRQPVDPTCITPEQRELLARMEHNRWLAERLINGWVYGPNDPRIKQRIAMVDWDRLNTGDAVKDFSQIDVVFKFCGESHGYCLVEAEPHG